MYGMYVCMYECIYVRIYVCMHAFKMKFIFSQEKIDSLYGNVERLQGKVDALNVCMLIILIIN